jgi:hypothetical protein
MPKRIPAVVSLSTALGGAPLVGPAGFGGTGCAGVAGPGVDGAGTRAGEKDPSGEGTTSITSVPGQVFRQIVSRLAFMINADRPETAP